MKVNDNMSIDIPRIPHPVKKKKIRRINKIDIEE